MSYFEIVRKTNWIIWNNTLIYVKDRYQKYGIIIAVISASMLIIWNIISLIFCVLILYPIALIIGIIFAIVNLDLASQISEYVTNELGGTINKLYKDSWELRK